MENHITTELTYMEQLAKVQVGLRAMKLLEELTPGGSEFYQNPENCAAFIRRRLEAQHNLIMRLKLGDYPKNGEPRSIDSQSNW